MRRTVLSFAAALTLCGFAAPAPARAEDGETPAQTARRENIERLQKDLKHMATSPRVAEKKPDIRKAIEALGILGGLDAAKASFEALAFDDEDVEKDVMALVEKAHDKKLVAPLAALIDDKDTSRRFRLHRLVAHALAVMSDASALEPLTSLAQSEDAQTVAAAADALATYRSAPHAKRVEPVKRLIDLYESTYNLRMSVRPEDRLATDRAKRDWEVFGTAVRKALQALTGQTNLSHPREFREWWNDHKKATNW
jgi:hypothetical protein